jgi:hypothetical protein
MVERKLRVPYTLHPLVRIAFCFGLPASSALQSSPLFVDVFYARIACLCFVSSLREARDTAGVTTHGSIHRFRCSYALCFVNIDY